MAKRYACPCCLDGRLTDDDGEGVACPFDHSDEAGGDGITRKQLDAFVTALRGIPVSTKFRQFRAAEIAVNQ